MATMVKFSKRKAEIDSEVYRRTNEAEIARPKEHSCALNVQSWFRATRVRKYFAHLNKNAILVQRWYRGHLGRKKYRLVLKEHVYQMKLKFYHSMAVKIQKIWRGYSTRKYVHDYYSMKRYMKGLVIKNELVRQELEEYSEQQKLQEQFRQEEKYRQKVMDYAKKHHHLLSTEVISGVYNSPFLPYPQEIEFHLRNTKPRTPPKEIRKTLFDPGYANYENKMEPLPPIYSKPQGPFRKPESVLKQRYKSFQPSLRVATDYDSVEKARDEMKQDEWVTRLNDDIFQPFSKTARSYEPMLHTTSKYGHLKYGTQYFREQHVDRHIVQKKFHSVVPPIPIFAKLNNTYSQGHV